MEKDYCSFLLRLRQVETEKGPTWVVAMQNIQTGHQQIFANLDGLIQFLQAEFDSFPEQDDTASSPLSGIQSFPEK